MTRHTRFGRPVFMTVAAILLLGGVAEVRIATVAAAESASPTGPGAKNTAPTPKSAPHEPASLEPLTGRDCTGVLGKKIIGPDGKELGLVVDVLVDDLGRPRAAIIDFGGFLGVGSRKIAVDWRLLKPIPGQPDWKLSLNLDRAEIQGAPEYKPDATSNKMVGPATPAPLPDAAK
ncbi:MAG: PRC-barrel domain-containing protein [Stellaceae bacterium]